MQNEDAELRYRTEGLGLSVRHPCKGNYILDIP
jgi:hypothetical protein